MQRFQSDDIGNYVPPAARTLDEFSTTEVGEDEIVVFDSHRMTYHTLNKPAWEVWRQCNGRRTIEEIAKALQGETAQLRIESARLAVDELGDSGLLGDSGARYDPSSSRRRLLKLAGAATAAAIAVPIVQSISAPTAASAASQLACNTACSAGDICNAGSCNGSPMCCCSLDHNPTLRFCGEDRGGGLCVVPGLGGVTGTCD